MKITTLAQFETDTPLEDDYEWREFIFEINGLSSANEGSDGYTTIELKSGYRQSTAMKWSEFKKMVEIDQIIIDPKAKYEYENMK